MSIVQPVSYFVIDLLPLVLLLFDFKSFFFLVGLIRRVGEFYFVSTQQLVSFELLLSRRCEMPLSWMRNERTGWNNESVHSSTFPMHSR